MTDGGAGEQRQALLVIRLAGPIKLSERCLNTRSHTTPRSAAVNVVTQHRRAVVAVVCTGDRARGDRGVCGRDIRGPQCPGDSENSAGRTPILIPVTMGTGIQCQ